ncbi:MAG: hypothetical protein ACI9LO_000175 [Planctomycetota bacterium]|jgi:hypothetical protein
MTRQRSARILAISLGKAYFIRHKIKQEDFKAKFAAIYRQFLSEKQSPAENSALT